MVSQQFAKLRPSLKAACGFESHLLRLRSAEADLRRDAVRLQQGEVTVSNVTQFVYRSRRRLSPRRSPALT